MLVTTLAALVLLLAPTATADQGDNFSIYPLDIEDREAAEVVKVCVVSAQSSSDTAVSYYFFQTHNNAIGGILQESATWDDEDCAHIELNRNKGGGPPTPYLAVEHTPAELSENPLRAVYWIGTNATFNATNQTQLAGTLSLSGNPTPAGFDVLTDHAEKAFWLGFGILFLFNRWMISGTYFVLGAFAQEAQWDITDTYLFAIGVIFVLFEWLIYTRMPQIREKIEAWRRGDAVARVRGGSQ